MWRWLAILFLVKAHDDGWERLGRNLTHAMEDIFHRASNAKVAAQPYPGDHAGSFPIKYEPHPDEIADPGEVVWTWVPHEEDHRQGKDRPVLIVGRDRDWLLALPLTSKDHDVDAEAHAGRRWFDIGPGDWDASGRPSEVRTDRVVRVSPIAVRRVGAKLDKWRFSEVANEIRKYW